MGESIYIDPYRQVFPFMQIARPWQNWAEQVNMEQKRAISIIQEQVADEMISQEDADNAMATRRGMVWDKALAQARNESDQEIQNPLDLAWTISGPSLPVGIAYNYLTGRQNRISQLPVTRLIQTATAAMGIGGTRGVNIEAGIRRALNLPEVDQFEDYRVDRQLANMAAEGVISADDAQRAMIDREGKAFDMAQKRVSQEGLVKYVGASLGADLFPEGEQKQRQIKKEFDRMIDIYNAGDKGAWSKFFEKYPEYAARLASFKDPEDRLRRFLISSVWEKYMELPDLQRKEAREGLGNVFNDAFLNKETRSYDSISTETLAAWAKMLGANNPKAAPEVPQTKGLELSDDNIANAVQRFNDLRDARFPWLSQMGDNYEEYSQTPKYKEYQNWRDNYLANNPQIIPYVTSEKSTLYGLPADVQAEVYQYRAGRQQFGDVLDTQEKYYAIENKKERSAFLRKHPELSEYWRWRRQYAAQHPKASPYILSDETIAKAILGDDYNSTASLQPVDWQQFSDPLMRQLLGNIYTGEQLSAGAMRSLEQIWRQSGRPLGNFEAWMETYVKPEL
jgi:hypothetical protein